MTLAYEYKTVEEANAAIADGTAATFFKPYLDSALGHVSEADLEFWKPEDASLRVKERADTKGWGYRVGRTVSWRVVLSLPINTLSPHYSYGSTEIGLRKDGTVNQGRVDEAVALLLATRHRKHREETGLAANKKRMGDIPEAYRVAVEPSPVGGVFKVRFREEGIRFERGLQFDQIVPVLDLLNATAQRLKEIQKPDNEKES